MFETNTYFYASQQNTALSFTPPPQARLVLTVYPAATSSQVIAHVAANIKEKEIH